MDNVITVYQAFNNAKHKKLINMYIDKYLNTEDLGKIGRKNVKKQLKKHLKHILKQVPKKTNDGHSYVFYVSHKLSDDLLITEPYFNLQRTDQLGSVFPSYAYELTPASEVLGYLIACTWRTKYYLDNLLVDIMFELSWTGYKQEKLKSEIHKLKKADKEVKKGKGKTFTVSSSKEMFEMFGLDISNEDHFDRKEYQLQKQISHDINTLISHSIDREAIKVRKLLSPNKNNICY